MVTRIAVLGSTGSVGRQTLQVAESLPGRVQVVGLGAGRNTELLNQQIERFHPALVSVGHYGARPAINHEDVLVGDEGLVALATHPDVDVVVVATSGTAGLAPTLAALRAGKEIALANKEVLVMAGELVMAEARAQGKIIRPVDSEHSALWQCLQGEDAAAIANLILTASGGPFREWDWQRLATATIADALKHPNWSMGQKITIDSATLMNKGFEVIEAHWLFGMPYDQIQVVIHPQSVIHSMVEFNDGSVKAQLGSPDMRLPIQYAILYPDRLTGRVTRLNWRQLKNLTFEEPDAHRFPCLLLAQQAGWHGATYPTVLSAADEVAVEAFLNGQITFLQIAETVDEVLTAHRPAGRLGIEDIVSADAWARRMARQVVETRGQQQHSLVFAKPVIPNMAFVKRHHSKTGLLHLE
jgi:1-deoxy-D-xylulose-5-phosphate reductoisomerase